ncbi:DUF222 domain-containing protein [Nocardioides sp. 1609]|uniref:DUF222 domain-containing protein n=1 Tax=Nocardioides sp. 1609 TaxID=2508327 RepID=UPI0014321D11|nr:DUF222 domain-containing protein [Nocardioides sp. 1609]
MRQSAAASSPSFPATAAACVDELARLEDRKAEIAARQARVTAHLSSLCPGSSDRSLGAQVGLARRESPYRGRRLLTLARGLDHGHPEVLALLEDGTLNERRAELICTETDTLDIDQRRDADRAIARLITENPEWGDRTIEHEARRVTMQADPDGSTARREQAQAGRHVSARSKGDGTGLVTGTVPDHEMVAIIASLEESAESLRASGDDRTRAQITADLFVERLTGQSVAAATPVHIELVVPVATLLAEGDEPAEVHGLGPVPAPVARRLALASPDGATRVRRLFAQPGRLVAMESSTQLFDGLLRSFVGLRDRRCRTPWCDAPIRHHDHVVQRRSGGATSAANAQGQCESCSYTKEEQGWTHQVVRTDVDGVHEVEIATPTGHRYRSRAPTPPGDVVPPEPAGRSEAVSDGATPPDGPGVGAEDGDTDPAPGDAA